MDLEIGRTDGILVDSVVGRYYMAKKPGKFKVIDDKMGDEKFGVGMRKEDTLLQDKLNDVLKQMSEDGTMTKCPRSGLTKILPLKYSKRRFAVRSLQRSYGPYVGAAQKGGPPCVYT